VDFKVLRQHPSISVSFHLHTQGVCAFVGGSRSVQTDAGEYRTRMRIPAGLLNSNTYSVSVFLISNVTELRIIEREVVAFTAEEIQGREDWLGGIIGTVRPKLQWSTEPLRHALSSR
jgi:hypothetical protein